MTLIAITKYVVKKYTLQLERTVHIRFCAQTTIFYLNNNKDYSINYIVNYFIIKNIALITIIKNAKSSFCKSDDLIKGKREPFKFFEYNEKFLWNSKWWPSYLILKCSL